MKLKISEAAKVTGLSRATLYTKKYDKYIAIINNKKHFDVSKYNNDMFLLEDMRNKALAYPYKRKIMSFLRCSKTTVYEATFGLDKAYKLKEFFDS